MMNASCCCLSLFAKHMFYSTIRFHLFTNLVKMSHLYYSVNLDCMISPMEDVFHLVIPKISEIQTLSRCQENFQWLSNVRFAQLETEISTEK